MDPHAEARKKFGPPPEDWEECETEDGDPYWYNKKTKSSRWFHPLDPTVLNDEGSARNLRKSKSLSSYDGKRQSEPEPRTESKEKKEKRNSLRVRAQTFLSKIVGSKSKDSKDIEEPRSLSASPSLESPKPKASLETEKTHSTPKSPRDKSPRDKSPRSTKDKSPKDGSKKGKKSKKNRKRHDAWEKNQSNTNDAFRTFRRESKKRLKESEEQRKIRMQREVDALFDDIKTDNHGRLLANEDRQYKKLPKTREEITIEAREQTLRAIRSRRKL